MWVLCFVFTYDMIKLLPVVRRDNMLALIRLHICLCHSLRIILAHHKTGYITVIWHVYDLTYIRRWRECGGEGTGGKAAKLMAAFWAWAFDICKQDTTGYFKEDLGTVSSCDSSGKNLILFMRRWEISSCAWSNQNKYFKPECDLDKWFSYQTIKN